MNRGSLKNEINGRGAGVAGKGNFLIPNPGVLGVLAVQDHFHFWFGRLGNFGMIFGYEYE